MKPSPPSQNNEKRGVLRFSTGLLAGRTVKLRRDSTILGRDQGNVVILDDTEASSTHCQIQKIGDDYHIFDMNSTNGTHVNGQRIVKARLKTGDTILIGKTTCIFSIETEEALKNIATSYQTIASIEDVRASVVGTLIDSQLRERMSGIVLFIDYPDGTKEEITQKEKVVYLGRASTFGKFDRDPELSRRHVMIKVNDQGEIFVEDQNSTNGVLLNGEKITGLHKVSKNDAITIGSGIKIRVRLLFKSAA